MQKEMEKITKATDMMAEPSGQSMRSKALSKYKFKLNMKDGDEHVTDHTSTIGPINDMYVAIRNLSCFPYGNAYHHGRVTLIHDTMTNTR